jgi:hypothetical protein
MEAVMRATNSLFDHILFGLDVVRTPYISFFLIVIEVLTHSTCNLML